MLRMLFVTYILQINNSVEENDLSPYLFTDMSQIETMLRNEVSLEGGSCFFSSDKETLQTTMHRGFLPGFVPLGALVLEEKIKLFKIKLNDTKW